MAKRRDKRSHVKWEGANRDDLTPFERFKELAGRLLRTPSADVDKQAKQERFETKRPKR